MGKKKFLGFRSWFYHMTVQNLNSLISRNGELSHRVVLRVDGDNHVKGTTHP